jgi:TolA-binding protein
MKCPSELELARGDEPALAHVAACSSCRAEHAAQRAAIELARELPAPIPSAAHREELRTALLARAELAPPAAPRSYARYAVAAAAASAALAVFAFHDRGQPFAVPELPAIVIHGTIHPHPDARFELLTASPDEQVALHDGTIDVEVSPLHAPERFRVHVGASDVEVRGTAFTVIASHDHLLSVTVAHGRVEVRPEFGDAILLTANQSWSAPVAAAVTIRDPQTANREPQTANVKPLATHRSPLAVIAGAPAAAPDPRPQPQPSPESIAYNEAWTALRAQRFHAAAAAFARALALAPEGPLADDARYWHAVALAREPRPLDAILAFRELLDEHAGGAHRGEASAMLGWLLVDAKQLAEARTRFTTAADDADGSVRASAVSGLEALRRARP